MPKRKVPVKLKFDLVDLLGRTPAPIQTQLLECTDFEVGAITGFAAGKTRGLVAKAMVHAVKYRGAKVAIGRKTFRETVNTVKQPAFIQWAPMYEAGWFTKPDEWVYTEGTNLVRLVNGSQIQFVNMSDPVKFRNEEFSLIIVDQAEEIDEPLFETLNGRCRWPLVPAEARQIIAGANDDGHNWVWHRFVRWPEEHAKDPNRCMKTERCVFDSGHPDGNGNPQPDMPCVTRKFFHGTTLDNKMNLAPQYLAVLTSRPAAWQDQFVWAKMTGGTGRLLPSLKEVEHFEPPKHWPRWYAMDHALQSPACGLWGAVNVDNHEVGGVNPQALYIYREYYESDRTVDQHAREVLSLSRGERFVDRVLDRSAWQLNQQGKNGMRHSIADLYNEAGLLMSPSTGDPWARVERIKTAHANGMVVSKNCTHLLRSAPEYHSTATNVEGVVKIVNKTAFHAVDALGYIVMAIPMKVEPFDLPIGDVYEGPSSLESAHRMAEARRARVAAEATQMNEGLGLVGLVPANPLYEGDTHATDFFGEDTEVADFNPYAEEESSWLS